MSHAAKEARKRGWERRDLGVWEKEGTGKILQDNTGWIAISEDENEVQFNTTLTECVRFFEGEDNGN